MADKASNPADLPFGARPFDEWLQYALALPDPDFLLYPFIAPKSFTVISGVQKISHKSWLLFTLFAAMSRKQGMFGLKPSKPTKCMYFSLEGNQKKTAQRFESLARGEGVTAEQLGADLRATGSIMIHDASLRLNDPDSLERLFAAQIAQKYDCIFIDTLARANGGNENSSQEMSTVMEAVEQLKRLGAAVVVAHHVNKSANEKDITEYDPDTVLRGSSALGGAYDEHGHIGAGPKGSDCLFIRLRGKDIEDMLYRLEWRADGPLVPDEHGTPRMRWEKVALEWEPTDWGDVGKISDITAEGYTARLLVKLAYDVTSLSNTWEVPPKEAERIANQLVEKGVLEKVGKKKYRKLYGVEEENV